MSASVGRRWETPFAQIPEWIIKADISSHAVRLWCALDRFAGLPNGAVPSRHTLAEDWLHVSMLTVDRAKAELVKIGALTVEERPGKANRYILENHPTLITDEGGNLLTGAERKIGSLKDSKDLSSGASSLRKSAGDLRAALWDALSDATGIVPEAHGEKTRFGMSVTELAKLGATPDEVRRRAGCFRERYPGATCTDRAIVNRWGELTNGANGPKRRYGTGVTSSELGQLSKRLRQKERDEEQRSIGDPATAGRGLPPGEP